MQHGFGISLIPNASSHFLDIQRFLSFSHLKVTSRNGKFIRNPNSWRAWKLEISLGNIMKDCQSCTTHTHTYIFLHHEKPAFY